MFSYLTIDSLQGVATSLGVSESLIAITALAFGTSLPELVVSIQAVIRKEIELVVGNVIGSNIFNILFVIGFSGVFAPLLVDSRTLTIGVPAMLIATFLFIISGISNRIHLWEGFVYMMIAVLFVFALIGIV